MNFPLFKAVLRVINSHSVQQVLRVHFHLTGSSKISSFQHTFDFGEQVTYRRLNSVNGGCVRVLECTYRLNIASGRRRCELEIVLVQNPLLLFPQFRSFLPHAISELGQDFEAALWINRLTLGYPFNDDYISDVEEKRVIIAFTSDLLVLLPFILGEVGVFQYIDCLFVSVVFFFSFTITFRIMHCQFLIAVTNPAERHNTVTLKHR